MARELAEDEGDEEHAGDRNPREPDVRGAGGRDAEDEERVDAHHRRQVRERNGKVAEEAERTVQLRLVAERFETRIVPQSGARNGRL